MLISQTIRCGRRRSDLELKLIIWLKAGKAQKSLTFAFDKHGDLDPALHRKALIHQLQRGQYWTLIISLLIPFCIDQNPWAHCRHPMLMIFHGRSIRLFHASQQRATMSS